MSTACTVSRTNATTSGRVANVVGPRNALSTDRVSGGRMPPISFAMRSMNPYSIFCRMPAGDAVQFINTALPMRSGYVAANVPPIMPPHELPTKCARSTPRPSSMSTMHRAQSAKSKVAVSFWLWPWPGGSTRMTRQRSAKWSACAAHMSPVIRRLGQNIIGSPRPRTCTRIVPSTVSSLTSSIGETLALSAQRGPPSLSRAKSG